VPARSKARKRAVDVLYEADLRSIDAGAVLAERRLLTAPPVAPYTAELVSGVLAHRDQIDALIGAHARGWELDRMPVVDRSILRLGAYELLHRPEVPRGVVLAEAVALAALLSTDGSPAFVNGLLARVAGLPAQQLPAVPDPPDLAGAIVVEIDAAAATPGDPVDEELEIDEELELDDTPTDGAVAVEPVDV